MRSRKLQVLIAASAAALSMTRADANDISVDYAFKLAHRSRVCSELSDAVLLYRPSHAFHPSTETCTFQDTIVKTRKGLRLLIAYSFTDENAQPESHGAYWVDIDCQEMQHRRSDGYYHFISKKYVGPSGGSYIFRMNNGWSIKQYKKSRGEWESMKNSPTDKALTKACKIYYL